MREQSAARRSGAWCVAGSWLVCTGVALLGCSSSDSGAGNGAAGAPVTGGAGASAASGSAGASAAGNAAGGAAGSAGGASVSGAGGASTAGASGGAAGGAPAAGSGGGAGAGDPAAHSQADVCAQWVAGHVITEKSPLTASGMACDAGTLKAGAISDTLLRINMFRWLEGLGNVNDDATYDADAQACSNLEAWWDFTSTASPHEPTSTAQCYTANGAATAGESNLSWGSGGPAQSIDQYMEDSGNETTLGHRRWIVNPPLNPVGIGYWQTGGTYGNASCLRIFASKGTGPKPSWNAVPPAGFAPLEMAKYAQWSFEGSLAGIASATASVTRVDDNTVLTVTQQVLSQGYGQDTMSFEPSGWAPEAGKTYRVTISGLTAGPVTYDVKPVTCD